MTIGLRIYDPDTGDITLDTTEGVTRLVHIIEDSSTSGTITIPAAVVGGGTLFWYPVDQSNRASYNTATISGNTVTYEKQSDNKIVIGVY